MGGCEAVSAEMAAEAVAAVSSAADDSVDRMEQEEEIRNSFEREYFLVCLVYARFMWIIRWDGETI